MGWTFAGESAGGGTATISVIVSHIVGGSPMGTTQFVHGRKARELIEPGLKRHVTEVAAAEHWKDVVVPPTLLNACTYKGKIYCVPANIHSRQWFGCRSGPARPPDCRCRRPGPNSSPMRRNSKPQGSCRWRSAGSPDRAI